MNFTGFSYIHGNLHLGAVVGDKRFRLKPVYDNIASFEEFHI